MKEHNPVTFFGTSDRSTVNVELFEFVGRRWLVGEIVRFGQPEHEHFSKRPLLENRFSTFG